MVIYKPTQISQGCSINSVVVKYLIRSCFSSRIFEAPSCLNYLSYQSDFFNRICTMVETILNPNGCQNPIIGLEVTKMIFSSKESFWVWESQRASAVRRMTITASGGRLLPTMHSIIYSYRYILKFSFLNFSVFRMYFKELFLWVVKKL